METDQTMLRILPAATPWHLVTCACALRVCSPRAIAIAKSTTHCQLSMRHANRTTQTDVLLANMLSPRAACAGSMHGYRRDKVYKCFSNIDESP